MMTYIALNIVFFAVVASILIKRNAFDLRSVMITLAALLTLTAIFDNFIIIADIVDYDTSKILGVYIVEAPVEDFFYAILAVVLVPAVWHKLGKLDA